MTRSWIRFAASVVALPVAAVQAGAQPAPAPLQILACAESHIVLGSGGTCATRHLESRASNGQVLGYSEQFVFQDDGTRGKAVLILQRAARGGASAGSFQPYTAQESEQALRALLGPIASAWGKYRGFGDTGYMDFRFGALHCVAIDHAGEAYAWIMRGYVCKDAASANLEEHVKSILAAIRIGPASSSRNALGTTVKPLS